MPITAALALTAATVVGLGCDRLSIGVPATLSSATNGDGNIHNTDRSRSPVEFVFSADGSTYVSRGLGDTVRVCDVETNLTLHSLTTPTKGIRRVVCNRDASSILVISRDGPVVIFTRTDGRYRSRMLHRFKRPVVCDLSEDGRQALLGTENGRVEIRDTESGKCLQLIATDARRVDLVRFSPDEKRVLYTCNDGTIHLWDRRQAAEVACFLANAFPVRTATFSPDGLRIATGHNDGWLHVWDADSGSELCSRKIGDVPLLSVDFSPCGRLVACGTCLGDITVRNASDCAEQMTWFSQGVVKQVEFSPDGTTVFAAFSGPNAALRRFEIPQDVGSLAEPNSSRPQNNSGTPAGDADKFRHR